MFRFEKLKKERNKKVIVVSKTFFEIFLSLDGLMFKYLFYVKVSKIN